MGKLFVSGRKIQRHNKVDKTGIVTNDIRYLGQKRYVKHLSSTDKLSSVKTAFRSAELVWISDIIEVSVVGLLDVQSKHAVNQETKGGLDVLWKCGGNSDEYQKEWFIFRPER